MKRSAVIVGAGIGGLTMAIRLAKQGFAVELFEARDEPGGRLGRVVKDGYTFDMGPTIVLMTDVFKRFFDELGLSMEDYLTFKRLDPNYRLHYADGSYMDSTSNLQGMLTEIHR
nr:FAD-dependent oxidoreductase [Bacilli bacterium]